ncbi:hypothetical protein [Kitasatospora cineracea]|uniref:Uncharacterized protein n=1 Tax=Kitasatospora cineracea TaxID=88074 RepID=A0A3N4R219_9ACTN|nr:hypothetical protein [Kitasatospora cineracea]RPE26626.1 hypothetical protein EDD38_7688 [Kitasatospora cineracea]
MINYRHAARDARQAAARTAPSRIDVQHPARAPWHGMGDVPRRPAGPVRLRAGESVSLAVAARIARGY